jgi:glyoxylase-like metal-dependent hydrolase (beta-lactamase superfamily II)
MSAKFCDENFETLKLMHDLPATLHFLERGWLSSNNILLIDDEQTVLIDTGYCTHAIQTEQLLASHLKQRPLDHIYNTHLHSDHCGGNAHLQTIYPAAQVHIPNRSAAAVSDWATDALSYEATGQSCPPFTHHSSLRHLDQISAGGLQWLVIEAPGHDPDSVMLFNEEFRMLISADALWENGFGVVFPEIEGLQAFDDVQATLEVIEQLAPRLVLPGHGSRFTDVAKALSVARSRLSSFKRSPIKHAHYAVKVLIKFKLMEFQSIAVEDFMIWAEQTPYFGVLHESYGGAQSLRTWITQYLQDLKNTGALAVDNNRLINL